MIRPRFGVELLVVAALSLGKSAAYAVVNLLDTVSRGPLAEAQAKLNAEASPRPWFDLTYQLMGIGFALVPVLLAIWLMNRDVLYKQTGSLDSAADTRPALTRMGLDFRAPGRDAVWGLGLFFIIGIGTLGVYFAGRLAGVTAEVLPNNLGAYWWTIPVLILSAAKNGILEEVLLLGYGFDRLAKLRWAPWAIIIALALARGSYHLYQGIGPFIGNVVMGLIFGAAYLRIRRVMPFVAAHTAIDIVGFLAPEVLAMVDPRL